MNLSSWRCAARLALREVRRRLGRTALVVLLIAVPVFGMTAVDILARTDASDDEFARRTPVDSDIVVTQQLNDAVVDVRDHLPPGAEVTTAVGSDSIPIETAEGTILSDVALERPGGSDLVRPVVVSDGRLPESSGEAWLSTPMAETLGLEVGDELTLSHPAGTWTVVGSGRVADSFGDRRLVVGDLPLDEFRPESLTQYTAIDLEPGRATPGSVVDEVGQNLIDVLNASEPGASEATVAWGDTSGRPAPVPPTLAWGWVGGVIALAAVGVIIAAAFATSARRQLVTVGLLSSNGASEGVIVRTLGLQGFWTGLIGAVAGMAGAVVGLLAARSTIESVRGAVLPGYEFVPLDLAVILVTAVTAATLAAVVPARTASRLPVVAALAGRRPLGRVPRHLVPIGVGLFTLGVFLLAAASSGRRGYASATAITGGLLVLAGMCCCSPLAIDAMSRAAARAGRSWRFAGRSLGRTRTRSAAVVTAIAVTGALAIVGSAAAMSLGDDGETAHMWPSDAVVLTYWNEPTYTSATDGGDPATVDYAPADERPLDDATQAEIDAIVPSATWHPRRVVTWDAPATVESAEFVIDADEAVAQSEVLIDPGTQIVVADDAMIDLYDLSDVEQQRLESTGALLLNGSVSWFFSGLPGDTVATIETTDGPVRVPVALRTHLEDEFAYIEGGPPASNFTGVWGTDAMMMTEAAARAAGLEIVDSGGSLRSDAPLTAEQRRLLSGALSNEDAAVLSPVYRDVAPDVDAAVPSVEFDSGDSEPAGFAVQAAVIGGAGLLAMLVVAIGLSLAAAEGRDERDVLIAVGAPPSTVRSLAGTKAVVLTVTGAVLAIPTGLIPTLVVSRATDSSLPVPWLGMAGLLVVVPATAGLAAWATSAVAQRVRPVRMSTLAVD